jgi:hypothetical protein
MRNFFCFLFYIILSFILLGVFIVVASEVLDFLFGNEDLLSFFYNNIENIKKNAAITFKIAISTGAGVGTCLYFSYIKH